MGRPGTHDARERLLTVLGELGFAAEADDDAVQLSGCPCPLVSPDRPELVFRLVAGAIAGALSAPGSPLRPGEETHDPAARRCSVRLVRLDAA